MKIGGHLSTSGGYHIALEKTIEIGGNALQIFASSPRQWSTLVIDDEKSREFVLQKEKLGIDPVYFHASYLVNMADNGFIGQKSRQRILEELTLAEKMRIKGTIIHLGSYKMEDKTAEVPKEKYETLLKNIAWVLERSNPTSYFIIEDAGNKKIGWSFDEITKIVNDLKDKRVKVCIDTCHMFAAGYAISTKNTFDRFFTKFDEGIGLQRLEVFQVNDSKDTLGSFRDRHENIGEGNIPSSVFSLLVNEKVSKDVPFILEVPGVEKMGPNKEQIGILKGFLQ